VSEKQSQSQRAEEMLETFLEGKLSPKQERGLSAHLEQCESCREELWALGLGRKAHELLVPPQGFEHALIERRERALAQIEEQASRIRRLRFVRRWWWVAASAAAMVLAVFLAWRRPASVEPPPRVIVEQQPTTPGDQLPSAVVEQEPEAPPAPELSPPVETAEAPAERKVTEVRFFWDGVQIVWLFDSDFKPW